MKSALNRLKQSLKSLYGSHRVSERWREHITQLIKEVELEAKNDGIIRNAFDNIPEESRRRVAQADTLDDMGKLWVLDKIEERVDAVPVKKVEMQVAHCYPGYRGVKDFIPKKIVLSIISDIRSDVE